MIKAIFKGIGAFFRWLIKAVFRFMQAENTAEFMFRAQHIRKEGIMDYRFPFRPSGPISD